MAQQTAPRSPRLIADQRIYNLGYSRGYEEAYQDGVKDGEEVFQTWLRAELWYLVQDIRLGLRHDVSTPLDVLAVVIALAQDGKPVVVDDDEATVPGSMN
jgi:hypothetical protein